MSAQAIRWWRSLGFRIATAIAVITCAVLVPVAFYVDYQASVDARERLRSETLNRMDAASALFRSFGQLRYSATTDPNLVPVVLRSLEVGQRQTYFDGAAMWAVERLSPEQILAVRSTAVPLNEQRAQLRRTLWIAGAGATLAGAGFGWLAGSRLSLRARRGAAAAERIAASEPGVVAAQPGGDEIAALTSAVDQLAAALNSRIERERAFTGHAAHELRTPLTGLVSAVELLADDEPGRLVRALATRLRVLVADLLEISRLDVSEPVELMPSDLTRAVRTSLEVSSFDEHVEVTVTSSAMVAVEQRRLDRVVANLVGNALRHGGKPVTVTVDERRLAVDDHGPGFPDWLIAGGPRRFGADGPTRGHGLGLVIAEAQAAAMGATVTFRNRPPTSSDPGGGRAEVLLAPAEATS